MSKLKVENGKFKIISALSGKDNTNANKVVNIKRYTSCRTRFGISKIASDSRLIATTLEMLNKRKNTNSLRSFDFSAFQHDVNNVSACKMTCGAKAALLSFAVARASSSLRQDGSRSGCPHILGFHPSAKAAFSLVEAMIILVLISVAIMMLIPLLGPQKMSVPAWKTDAANSPIYYNLGGSVDRVGVGRGINPFNSDSPAKLAVTTMAVTNTNNTSCIQWGDNYISNAYCGKSSGTCVAANDDTLMVQNNSIQLGMNTCQVVDAQNRIIINSNQNRSDPCNVASININNAILQVGDSLAIKIANANRDTVEEATVSPNDTLTVTANPNANLATNSLIYIKSNGIGNKDIFRINFNDNNHTPAMWYNGTTLAILPSGGNMRVNGQLFMAGYTSKTACMVPTADNSSCLACDTTQESRPQYDESGNPVLDESGNQVYGNVDVCTKSHIDYTYKDNNSYTYKKGIFDLWDSLKGTGSLNENPSDYTFTNPSDIRLKNILSEYTKGVKDILKVDTYTYSYKSDKENKTYVGIIAQKLKGVFDEALHKDEKGFYSYERTPLLYAMTNSVKDIHTKQSHIENEQNRTAKEADRLIRMYK